MMVRLTLMIKTYICRGDVPTMVYGFWLHAGLEEPFIRYDRFRVLMMQNV